MHIGFRIEREAPAAAVAPATAATGSDEVARLSKLLADDIRAYRRYRRRRFVKRLVKLVVVAGLVYGVVTRRWIMPWYFWILIGGGAVADQSAGRRRTAATALADTGDPRAVNVLAAAALLRDRSTRAVAVRGLKRILPTLKATDARHISPAGMRSLASLLNYAIWDTDMLMRVIAALEQVGDATAAPALERMMHPPRPVGLIATMADRWIGLGATAQLGRLQAAARDALAAVQRRAEDERLRNTLLRPASALADPSGALVRPVQAATTPDERLVLPAVPDEAVAPSEALRRRQP